MKIASLTLGTASLAAQGARLGLLVWMLVVGLAAQRPDQGPPPLVKENSTVRISEHVHLIPDGRVRFVPNVGIVVGSRAALVVDTGLGARNAETVLREVEKVASGLDLYLVTTHFHPEHAGGAFAFPEEASYLVSRAQQRDLDELALDLAKRFAGFTPLMGELLADVRFRSGDILFEKEHDLELGGVRVRLLSLGSTHTRGDTVIFVEGDRVLFSGDVVMNQAFLSFNPTSSAQTWLSVLDQLEALRPVIIVPSHGDRGDAALIGQCHSFLKELQRRVGDLKARGDSSDQIAEQLHKEFQGRHPTWRNPNWIDRAVQVIYRELP